MFFLLTDTSTFIGIAVHNATATGAELSSIDLAAGVRQDASGLLGTTLQLSDLVSRNFNLPLLCKMEDTRHDADLLMARSSLSPIFSQLRLCRSSLLLLEASFISARWPFYQRE